MESIRLSLLTHASTGSSQAWSQMIELYQPLVYRWLRRHEISHHDAEELTQDVLLVVVRELPIFVHSGRTGGPRCWLRQITANRPKRFWRAGKMRSRPRGSCAFIKLTELLADDASDLSHRWCRLDRLCHGDVLLELTSDLAG